MEVLVPNLSYSELLELQTTPEIVCLCGSTKFNAEFQHAMLAETLAGNVVLSVAFGVNGAGDDEMELSISEKNQLDLLHLQKVRMAHRIVILNKGGYVGESTFREFVLALALDKRIVWLEAPDLRALMQLLGAVHKLHPYSAIIKQAVIRAGGNGWLT